MNNTERNSTWYHSEPLLESVSMSPQLGMMSLAGSSSTSIVHQKRLALKTEEPRSAPVLGQ